MRNPDLATNDPEFDPNRCTWEEAADSMLGFASGYHVQARDHTCVSMTSIFVMTKSVVLMPTHSQSVYKRYPFLRSSGIGKSDPNC